MLNVTRNIIHWFSHPSFNVRVMIMADVIDREHGSVLLGVPSFRPKTRKVCGSLRRYAQHHHRGAFVVVNQRPKFTARVPKRPFRYNIFSRFRVTLHGATMNKYFSQQAAKWIVREMILYNCIYMFHRAFYCYRHSQFILNRSSLSYGQFSQKVSDLEKFISI